VAVASTIEVSVRMGELAASRQPHDVLVTVGLGSCIGLALVDPVRCVAGLAHVVLPEVGALQTDTPAKFGDLAVPALLAELTALGAMRSRLQAVIVGGAQMFSFGGGGAGRLDVGARNEAAVRAALASAHIPVVAAATKGSTGRTLRVHVGEGRVSAKPAGGATVDLMGGTQ
jgi:chemotaxis protein CheD